MAREGAPASRFIPRMTVLGKPEACELFSSRRILSVAAGTCQRAGKKCEPCRENKSQKQKSRPRGVGFFATPDDRSYFLAGAGAAGAAAGLGASFFWQAATAVSASRAANRTEYFFMNRFPS